MDKVIEIVRQFGLLILEVAPYFVLGALAGATLKSWLPLSIVDRHLKPGIRSILALSVLGGLLPVCSCSMMPLARAMRERGAALGAVMAFLVTAPVVSPVTIALTWGWLGPEFAVARVVAAFAGAIVLGISIERFTRRPVESEAPSLPKGSIVSSVTSCGCANAFFPNLLTILKDLWGYLLIGIAISAVISVLVPTDLIPSLLGNGPLAFILAAVVGVPIYVCSGEEVPIAKALLSVNLSPGATFTFLLSSTGTCLPTILMASKFLGKKNAALYALFWLVFSIGAGLVFAAAW
ncbi:MAG: permease [Candidatus Eisenbacteria bacterium]|nr:permease [Candidatus Eisenbacteria bacterium]